MAASDGCSAADVKADSKAEAKTEPKAGAETKWEGDDHLTPVPTLKWILKAREVKDAKASTEKEMKPYTETIPGSDIKFDMVPIPGGEFTMGSPKDEEDRQESEGPQRQVKVAPFWMGKCEVTWDEYDQWATKLNVKMRKHKKINSDAYDKLADALAAPTPAYCDMTFGMGHDGYPAICMTQLAAKMYCKWLSAKTGHYYRLPTEAEWEYACRAGSKTAYCFGDDPEKLDDYGWYYDNSDEQYQKVGKKKPNAWGLYDMHGNVAEWVVDQFTEKGYPKSQDKILVNPINVPKTLYPRVVRGGTWDDDPDALRSAARRGSEKEWKKQDPQIPQSIWYHTDADFIGFRVVRPLTKPTLEESKIFEPDAKSIKEYKEAHSGRE
jgi:formylglycine-generating enzyme required for sulfatase activity